MDKKDFLKKIHYSTVKNRRKKILIFLFSFSLIVFFFFFIYSLFGEFYSSIYLRKPSCSGIEKSFLYSNSKKAHNIKKDEITKLFTYSFTIKDEDILDKKEWFLFLKTVPSVLKFRNKNYYQIYGFLNKEDLNKQVKELIKEKIVKKVEIHEPKIDKRLLK